MSWRLHSINVLAPYNTPVRLRGYLSHSAMQDRGRGQYYCTYLPYHTYQQSKHVDRSPDLISGRSVSRFTFLFCEKQADRGFARSLTIHRPFFSEPKKTETHLSHSKKAKDKRHARKRWQRQRSGGCAATATANTAVLPLPLPPLPPSLRCRFRCAAAATAAAANDVAAATDATALRSNAAAATLPLPPLPPSAAAALDCCVSKPKLRAYFCRRCRRRRCCRCCRYLPQKLSYIWRGLRSGESKRAVHIMGGCIGGHQPFHHPGGIR